MIDKITLKQKLIKKLIESVDIPVLTEETEKKIYDAIFQIFDDLIDEYFIQKYNCAIS